MKIENLKPKRFFINCGNGKPFDLLPASGVVELPEGFDKGYVHALEKSGSIRVCERDVEPEDNGESDEDDLNELREEYKNLSGDDADGRWGIDRLKEEIEKLSE